MLSEIQSQDLHSGGRNLFPKLNSAWRKFNPAESGWVGLGSPLRIEAGRFDFCAPVEDHGERAEEAHQGLLSQPLDRASTAPLRSGKVYRDRSRLYRNQILQVNMRLKALAEIYTMHAFAQFCSRIVKKLRRCMLFFAKFSKFSNMINWTSLKI